MEGRLSVERRRRITHRALPALALLALAALAVSVVAGGGRSESERTAADLGAAWERGDFGALHALLSPAARARVSPGRLEAAYRDAAAKATATGVTVSEPQADGDRVRLPVAVRTRIFGTLTGDVELPVAPDGGLDWAPHLVLPGIPPGAALERRTQAPPRARIVSADGIVLARGPAGARESPRPDVAASIAGRVAPVEDEADRRRLYERGFDEDTAVGVSGLERVFERRLAGRPGGELLAGGRVVARATPRPAPPVRTTIDTRIQAAAAAALAGRLGGVAALDPATGEIVALAGIAFSGPQPPGSTFKIVTLAAALEAGAVTPADEFPIETSATIDGVELENANGEWCGGGLLETFAHSCNSVFAPLGVEVGAERLVDAAQRFGWNEQPAIPGALASVIPQAAEILTPLEVASTAIGQFRTLSTTLQMASVAQTIANRGVRLRPVLAPRGRPVRGERAVSRRIARTIGRMMVAVVESGTGTLAHVDGVAVAGKTGTAELGDTRGDDPEAAARYGDPTNTTAWFTAYAPADRPRIAVAVMLVRQGAGGATAAPAAQPILVAALQATR